VDARLADHAKPGDRFAGAAQAQAFTPASASDWQRDVTANALLEAAFDRMGDSGAR
jgi:hypothetical protein